MCKNPRSQAHKRYKPKAASLYLQRTGLQSGMGSFPTVQSGSGMIIDVRELLDVKGDKKK